MKNYFFWILIFFYHLNAARALEIHVPLASPEINFNPTKLYDQSSLWIERHTQCQLTRKEQGEIVLEAASSINFLDSQRLQVNLNPTYKFPDGNSVTSQDVIATFEFLKQRTSYRAQFSLIDKIIPMSPTVLIFIFKKSTSQLFLDFFSTSHNPILSQSFIAKAKVDKKLLESPPGCGKYKVAEYLPGDRIVLESVQKRYPKIIFYLQKNNQISADQIDRFDLVYLNIRNLEKYKTKILEEFQESSLFDPYQIVFSLNTTMEPWIKEENRCALYSSMDSRAPIEEYQPDVIASHDLFPGGVLGYNASNDFQSYYKSRGGVKPKLNRPFCISFVNASIPESKRRPFLKMINEIYPNVVTKQIANPENFGPTFLDQKCDGIIIGFKSDNLDGADFMNVFTEKAINYTGYWNKELQQSIDESQAEDDLTKRVISFQKNSNEIKNKCLIFPILSVPYKHFYTRRTLKFPKIEKSILNEYFLGDVVEQK